MTKVFIGGSRRLSRLSPDVKQRVDRIIEKGLTVLIGDANGADKTVQRYLQEHGHERVQVFSAAATPRNNAGAWPVRVIRPSHTTRDFEYYAAKDRAMASEASVGLMLWDGESRGTLMNILRLVAQHKTVVVYVSPEKTFAEVRRPQDFERLVQGLEQNAAQRLHEQALSEGLLSADLAQPQLPL